MATPFASDAITSSISVNLPPHLFSVFSLLHTGDLKQGAGSFTRAIKALSTPSSSLARLTSDTAVLTRNLSPPRDLVFCNDELHSSNAVFDAASLSQAIKYARTFVDCLSPAWFSSDEDCEFSSKINALLNEESNETLWRAAEAIGNSFEVSDAALERDLCDLTSAGGSNEELIRHGIIHRGV